MRNLSKEDDDYGVIGEPIDLPVERFDEIPDHLLLEKLPPWGWGDWATCAVASATVVISAWAGVSAFARVVTTAF